VSNPVQIMRVLLVRPYPELRVARVLEKGFLRLEPLNLEIVAGAVPRGDDVEILDLCLHEEPMAVFTTALTERPPDIVGFTGYSSHARQVKRLARFARGRVPEALIVVGGIHATIVPHDYAIPEIDVIVRGEGGTAFAELVKRFKAGETPHFDDRALDPRAPGFEAQCAAAPPAYPAYEAIPRPRRDLVNRADYFSVWTSATHSRLKTMFPPVATLRTSVGCAFNCSFCVVPYLMGRRYVQREPEDVVDEIASIKEDHIYFVDDETFLNPTRVTRIAELLLERGIRKEYYSWARSDTIVKHPEVFKLWRKAGLGTVYVGLESMNDEHLDGYGKKTAADVNLRAVEILRECDITLHGCFIVRPDATVEDFRALEREIKRFSPAEITFTVLSPSPGTEAWHRQKEAFICDPYYFYDCMHSVLPTRLPLPRFYAHFSRLYSLAFRANPLRAKRVRVPLRDLWRAIVMGTKYILSLRAIYRDYYEDTEYCADYPA